MYIYVCSIHKHTPRDPLAPASTVTSAHPSEGGGGIAPPSLLGVYLVGTPPHPPPPLRWGEVHGQLRQSRAFAVPVRDICEKCMYTYMTKHKHI